jgi:hypothetical protein
MTRVSREAAAAAVIGTHLTLDRLETPDGLDGVAGLVDGRAQNAQVGDSLDGDASGIEPHLDSLDAGDGGHLGGDRPHAVVAAHARDGQDYLVHRMSPRKRWSRRYRLRS